MEYFTEQTSLSDLISDALKNEGNLSKKFSKEER